MTKRRWTILAGAIVLGGGLSWTLLGREPVLDGRCKLRLKRVSQPSGLIATAYHVLPASSSDGNSVNDLPGGFDQPHYYRVRIKGTELAMVVNGGNSWTACLDTNHDGRLSDERPIRGKVVRIRDWGKDQRHYLFGPIELTFPDGSGVRTARFHLLGYRVDASGKQSNEQPGTFAIYPADYRTGRLRIGERTYKVAVIDGDHDGRFEPVTLTERDRIGWPLCDYFAIDLDGDGQFRQDLSQRDETQPLGRMVLLQDVYYAIDISRDGQELSLRSIDPEMGTLVWDHAGCRMECRLWSDAADQRVTVPAEQKELALPSGRYSVVQVIVRTTDASGEIWEIKSAWNFRNQPSFEIETGRTRPLEIGPPFTCTSRVTKVPDGTIRIEPVLKGAAGEEYSCRVLQTRRLMPAPTITIVDEKGTVLTADSFEYG